MKQTFHMFEDIITQNKTKTQSIICHILLENAKNNPLIFFSSKHLESEDAGNFPRGDEKTKQEK